MCGKEWNTCGHPYFLPGAPVADLIEALNDLPAGVGQQLGRQPLQNPPVGASPQWNVRQNFQTPLLQRRRIPGLPTYGPEYYQTQQELLRLLSSQREGIFGDVPICLRCGFRHRRGDPHREK